MKPTVVLLALLSLILAMSLSAAGTAVAQEDPKPINLAIFNPVQIFDEDTSIRGVRFNLLYGRRDAPTLEP